MSPTFEQVLAEHYRALSPALRKAGDYLAAHPLDVITRSMRSMAQDAGIAPASFSRLARALGYADYEALREVVLAQLGRRVSRYAARAESLRAEARETTAGLLGRSALAAHGGLDRLISDLDVAAFEAAAARLHAAERVFIIGALGSTGLAEYLGYMANLMGDRWQLAGRMGGSLVADMAQLGPRDAALAITTAPSAFESVQALEVAAKTGAYTMVLTDSHTSPALHHASAHFLVPSEAPAFFTSYVSMVFLLENLVAVMLRLAGPEAVERMADVERINRAKKVVVDR